MGSAAIAHSAVRTKEPITEGFVSLLEPFIDTVVICTMTALVIIITGQLTTDAATGLYILGENGQIVTATGATGVGLTSAAFGSALPWFPYVLVVAVLVAGLAVFLRGVVCAVLAVLLAALPSRHLRMRCVLRGQRVSVQHLGRSEVLVGEGTSAQRWLLILNSVAVAVGVVGVVIALVVTVVVVVERGVSLHHGSLVVTVRIDPLGYENVHFVLLHLGQKHAPRVGVSSLVLDDVQLEADLLQELDARLVGL